MKPKRYPGIARSRPTGLKDFRGVQARKIESTINEVRMAVVATVFWLRTGGMITVAAQYQDNRGPGGSTVVLVHSRVHGLLYNSLNGQAISCETLMGDDYMGWTGEYPDELIWTEAAIRYALTGLQEKLVPLFELKNVETSHPWFRRQEEVDDEA